MWDAGDQGAQDWLSLEPALINVLRAPSLVAAMQKILGVDYQMAAPWCNRKGQGGMMGYHITGADNVGNDQGFHKDGTGTRRFALQDRCASCLRRGPSRAGAVLQGVPLISRRPWQHSVNCA